MKLTPETYGEVNAMIREALCQPDSRIRLDEALSSSVAEGLRDRSVARRLLDPRYDRKKVVQLDGYPGVTISYSETDKRGVVRRGRTIEQTEERKKIYEVREVAGKSAVVCECFYGFPVTVHADGLMNSPFQALFKVKESAVSAFIEEELRTSVILLNWSSKRFGREFRAWNSVSGALRQAIASTWGAESILAGPASFSKFAWMCRSQGDGIASYARMALHDGRVMDVYVSDLVPEGTIFVLPSRERLGLMPIESECKARALADVKPRTVSWMLYEIAGMMIYQPQLVTAVRHSFTGCLAALVRAPLKALRRAWKKN